MQATPPPATAAEDPGTDSATRSIGASRLAWLPIHDIHLMQSLLVIDIVDVTARTRGKMYLKCWKGIVVASTVTATAVVVSI
jgi:hypothetical protein